VSCISFAVGLTELQSPKPGWSCPNRILDAIPYVKNGRIRHHGKRMPFATILKNKLTDDPALVLPDKIVNGADTDNTLCQQHRPEPEPCGRFFRNLGARKRLSSGRLQVNALTVYDLGSA